ncbi:MAG: hypothetical protein R3246_12010 [Acidimicrobiia bacterium]|nr:hypothetical protein [Acidimicrobiia bacterium]
MTSERRQRLGWVGVVVGGFLLVMGVLVAHFTNLPLTDSVGREIYSWIPRCAPFENDPNSCWMVPTLGQATAFLGSQLMVAGIVFGWLFDRPLTWARATVGAFLFTLEVMLFFAIVPNQMVALMQGTFEWTSQKNFITIPPWLVLNNNVSISYGTLKDLLVAGYATTMLVAFLVVAYQYQERMKRRGQPPPTTTSVYGRPVVKGGGR